MNKRFKNSIRQIHLWLGLGTSLIVFVISITGCLYVFEEEIRELTQKDFRYVPAQQKGFVGLDKIIGRFEKLEPKGKIRLIRLAEQFPNATVAITTKKEAVYYFNPYDATLVKKAGLDWLDVVQHIHTSLLLGEVGKFIIRWSVVIFVVMLLTGLVLWFPNQMRLLRQSLTIKKRASFKRLNYDLHNVLGFYASILLLITACSGLYFAFKEVKSMASFFTGTKLSRGKEITALEPLHRYASAVKSDTSLVNRDALPVRYNKIYKEALSKYPGAISSSISVRGTGELRLRMVYPYRCARNQNTFFYDEATAKPLKAKLYKDFNGADLVEATNYDLHTGKLFGLFSKSIAFMASLISASLPVTGFIIWWRKKTKSAKTSRVKKA